MPLKYPLYLVDAFTTERFKGNPAGVVPHADGLTKEQMQAVAREMNCSETAFVLTPTDSGHDVHLRYFTPKVEVPICGHATIAAHFVRATESASYSGVVRQRTQVGVLPVKIDRDEKGILVTMAQAEIVMGRVLSPDLVRSLMQGLGITAAELDERCPVQIVSTGHSKVLVGLRSHRTLNGLQPDLAALSSLSARIQCNGYFMFTLDSPHRNYLTAGRMFAPAIGIAEDPVTGNGNGPLGAYLIHHGLVETSGDTFRFTGLQGEAIGRGGECFVAVHLKRGKPHKIEVGGRAVIVFRTEIEL